MRLIITAIVCSLLTVGGFFGFKQYQRAEMQKDARAYIMTMVQRNSQNFGAEAEAQIADRVRDLLGEVFGRHYESGGLTKPAEFDEVNFGREMFAMIHDDIEQSDVSEETKEFAKRLYIQSRPLQRGALGGVGGGTLPEDTPEDEVPGDEGSDG